MLDGTYFSYKIIITPSYRLTNFPNSFDRSQTRGGDDEDLFYRNPFERPGGKGVGLLPFGSYVWKVTPTLPRDPTVYTLRLDPQTVDSSRIIYDRPCNNPS